MATCLLDVLSRPNPVIDSTNSARGPNTVNSNWGAVTGYKRWDEFNYETLISCYGDVLQRPLAWFPETSPPLRTIETEIWDENSLCHLLTRTTMSTVGAALEQGWEICYPGNLDPIDIGTGGVAKIAEDDPRFYPDWAGVRGSVKQDGRYINLCPGETKLSTKWDSRNTTALDYKYPVAQIQAYCGQLCKKRYGYLITQKELYVVRVSREDIGPGLATSRSQRASAAERPTHQRNISQASGMSMDRTSLRAHGYSISSISSGIDMMSVSKGSSYYDNEIGVEYNSIEFASIPWSASGSGKLTIKLALWWIHMLASAPGQGTFIELWYLPLDSWAILENGSYRHVSTGAMRKQPPHHALIYDPNPEPHGGGPSDPTRASAQQHTNERPVGESASSPPLPTCEDIKVLRWSESQRGWHYTTATYSGIIYESTWIWSTLQGAYYRAVRDASGNPKWVGNYEELPSRQDKGKGKQADQGGRDSGKGSRKDKDPKGKKPRR